MNENFYKEIINESPIGYAYHKILIDDGMVPYDYEFIEVNSTFESFTGLKGSNIIGKKVTAVLPDIRKDEFDWIKFYGEVAISGEKKQFDQFSESLNKWYRVYVYSPEKYYFITQFVDISKEKDQVNKLHDFKEQIHKTEMANKEITYKALKEVLENKNFLEALLDFIPSPLFYKDINGRYLGFNKAFETFFGETKEKLIGKSVFDINPEDLARIYHAKDAVLFEHIGTQTYETKVKDAKGDLHDVIFNKASMTDSLGNITGLIGMVLDITDRKRAEDALKISEEEYRCLFENAVEAIVVIQNNTIKICNPMAQQISGYSNYELMTMSFLDLVYDEDMESVRNIYNKRLKEDAYNSKQAFRLVKKGGEIRWVESIGIKITWQGKESLLSFLIDTTDRKMSEKALRESEKKYRNLIMNSHDIIFTLTPEGVFSFVSPAWTSLLGQPVSQIIGQPFWQFVHPDDIAGCMTFMQEVITTQIRQTGVEYRVIHNDGSWRWHTTSAAPQKDEMGVVIGYEGIARDITERKKLETELLEEKNLLMTTLISVGDGVISTDNKGNIVFLNRVAESLTGWTQEEAKDKPIGSVFNIVNEYTKEKRENIVKKVLESGIVQELANHTTLVSKDGIERPIEDSAAPITKENGEIIGVVLVFRDFSEKKQKIEKIEYLSYHDQLTGLYNRRFYEEELKRLDTERNLPMSIIMGDVNGLKLVNDTFGHAIGDRLLKKVAKAMKKGCRSDDIIARLGGDEFVVILPKTGAIEASHIIERIKNYSSKEKVESIDISVSFGHDTKINKEEKIQEIFKHAEDHMYRHKHSDSPKMKRNTMGLIIKSLYDRNKREHLHSIGVSEISEAIAIKMGFNDYDVSQIRIAGLMHDIGKIEIAEEILKKPNKLNDNELSEIKRHPETGCRILSMVNEFSEIADYVLEHHERWDGTGYPRYLKGEEILLQARIIALADSYDAMTTERPYKRTLCKLDAIDEIKKCSGTQFDPNVVKIFVTAVLGEKWSEV